MLCPCVCIPRDSRTHATRELRPQAASTRVDPSSADRLEGFFVGPTRRRRHREDEQMTEQKAVRAGDGAREAAGTVTGAQSLIKSLESAGAENIFGIPGGAILPAYDPLFDSQDPAHPGAPRAGRRPRRAGVRRRPPARSASAWPPAARARPTWSPRSPTPTWTRSRWSRSPARSAAAAIGTDAFQEADIRGITMPITKHNFLVTDPAEIPRVDRRGVLHRLHRPPRPGAGRRRQVGAAGDDHVRLADRAQPARLPPGDPAARQADPRGDPADRSSRAARCSTSAAA